MRRLSGGASSVSCQIPSWGRERWTRGIASSGRDVGKVLRRDWNGTGQLKDMWTAVKGPASFVAGHFTLPSLGPPGLAFSDAMQELVTMATMGLNYATPHTRTIYS